MHEKKQLQLPRRYLHPGGVVDSVAPMTIPERVFLGPPVLGYLAWIFEKEDIVKFWFN